jgi:anionic cell wall polymer biosynthesis LytR-Cps2A-Psr (LCP) family protein
MAMKKRDKKGSKTIGVEKWAFQNSYKSVLRLFTAFFTGLLLLGLLAFFILTVLPDSQDYNGGTGTAAAKIVNASDSFTMLMTFYDGAGTPVQLMLFRLDTSKRRMVVMPVPVELRVERSGATSTLKDEILQSGTGTAITSLTSALHIKIGFGCRISADNLLKILQQFGEFNYTVPESISYILPPGSRTITIQSGSNTIDGTKALALISNSAYNGGSDEQYQVQAGLMKAFVSQKMTGYYLEHADDLFKTIFNLVTTDFTMNDLVARLYTIKSISAHNNFAASLSPSCNDVSLGGTRMVSFDEKTLTAIRSYFAED